MAATVSWAASALSDVERVLEHIAVDSEYYAAGFARRIRDAARSLETFPERAGIVTEIGSPDIREILVGRYRMIYQIRESNVSILAFVHGARDLKGTWERKPRDPAS